MRESGARFSIWDTTQAPDTGQDQGPEPTPESGASELRTPGRSAPRDIHVFVPPPSPCLLPSLQLRALPPSVVPTFSHASVFPLARTPSHLLTALCPHKLPSAPPPSGATHRTVLFHTSVWLLLATVGSEPVPADWLPRCRFLFLFHGSRLTHPHRRRTQTLTHPIVLNMAPISILLAV